MVGWFSGLHCLSRSPATPDGDDSEQRFVKSPSRGKSSGMRCFSINEVSAVSLAGQFMQRIEDKYLGLLLVTSVALLRRTKLSLVLLTQLTGAIFSAF